MWKVVHLSSIFIFVQSSNAACTFELTSPCCNRGCQTVELCRENILGIQSCHHSSIVQVLVALWNTSIDGHRCWDQGIFPWTTRIFCLETRLLADGRSSEGLYFRVNNIKACWWIRPYLHCGTLGLLEAYRVQNKLNLISLMMKDERWKDRIRTCESVGMQAIRYMVHLNWYI